MKNLTKKSLAVLIFFIVFCTGSYLLAATSETPILSFVKQEKKSFAPIRGEKWRVHVQYTQAAPSNKLSLEIRSSDNDLIRTLPFNAVKSKPNVYQAIWDGKDSERNIVPDEAYHPVIVLTNKTGQIHRHDPRLTSGGEEVYDFEKNINPGVIEYTLPVASRILIRAGIKNGPMLRTITDWEVKSPGFHAQRWNGWDKDKTMVLEQQSEVAYLIIGYQLPEHTIITFGNTKENYRTYRERKKFPIKQTRVVEQQLSRSGKVIRPEFYQPLLQQKSPRIHVNLLSKKTQKPITKVNNFDELVTQVKIHPLDEMYLDQVRYEISFFVDNEFIAEEEQGFVPYSWRWSPARLGIKPGKHILTVNISGYNGQVGVKNIPFILTSDKK